MNRITPDEAEQAIKKMLRGRDDLFPAHLCAHHPQIVEKICMQWEQPARLQHYFEDLLISDRQYRAGFSQEAYSEIFRLSNYYSTLYSKGDNCWEDVDTR
jgi:hypothetical protein